MKGTKALQALVNLDQLEKAVLSKMPMAIGPSIQSARTLTIGQR